MRLNDLYETLRALALRADPAPYITLRLDLNENFGEFKVTYSIYIADLVSWEDYDTPEAAIEGVKLAVAKKAEIDAQKARTKAIPHADLDRLGASNA